MAAIVFPCAEFVDQDAEYGSHFNRFLLRLMTFDAAMVDRTLAGRYNEGYQRCLSDMRRLMPGHSRPTQSRRFIFLGTYLSSLLAQREAMLRDLVSDHPTWRSAEMLDDIVRTGAAILAAPA